MNLLEVLEQLLELLPIMDSPASDLIAKAKELKGVPNKDINQVRLHASYIRELKRRGLSDANLVAQGIL